MGGQTLGPEAGSRTGVRQSSRDRCAECRDAVGNEWCPTGLAPTIHPQRPAGVEAERGEPERRHVQPHALDVARQVGWPA
jgi:hypothetical protein